jgi:hypothetical protein
MIPDSRKLLKISLAPSFVFHSEIPNASTATAPVAIREFRQMCRDVVDRWQCLHTRAASWTSSAQCGQSFMCRRVGGSKARLDCVPLRTFFFVMAQRSRTVSRSLRFECRVRVRASASARATYNDRGSRLQRHTLSTVEPGQHVLARETGRQMLGFGQQVVGLCPPASAARVFSFRCSESGTLPI